MVFGDESRLSQVNDSVKIRVIEGVRTMNILVTGGIGVNGSWVSRQLLVAGHKVVIFENRIDTSPIPDIADKVDISNGRYLGFGYNYSHSKGT